MPWIELSLFLTLDWTSVGLVMNKMRVFHISISTQPFELWCFCHIRPFEISWNLRNTPGWDCSDGKSSVVHYKGNDDSLMILINWPNLYFRSSLHLLLFPFSLPLSFSITDDRKNSNGQQMEFKSNQWFGATVRSSGDHILVSLSVEGVKVALKKDCTELKKEKTAATDHIFVLWAVKIIYSQNSFICTRNLRLKGNMSNWNYVVFIVRSCCLFYFEDLWSWSVLIWH